jgi:hypothetical protein
VNFFVLNHDIKHTIEENLSELERPLADMFGNLVFSVAVSKTKIADFTTETSKRARSTTVDIRV